MIGGLLTSAFLTLEIIPVVYTYWRQEQLLWERLADLDPARLLRLQAFSYVQAGGWGVLVLAAVSRIYVSLPAWALVLAISLGAAIVLAGGAGYLSLRPAARRLVWPEKQSTS
jgi:Cu(I)/Ag(I) efflux system membrane protein CusA/SilA